MGPGGFALCAVLVLAAVCAGGRRPARVPAGVPAAAWLALMGRAAVCAGGRRPAREIATRELRSEWSISRPALALPPPTGTAARPSGPSGALHTSGAWSLMCGSARRLEARPGSAIARGHHKSLE